MNRTKDPELDAYREQLGSEEYHTQYCRLYTEAKQDKKRYSGLDYVKSAKQLDEIRRKYNTATKEQLEGIVSDMLDNLLNIPKER